MHIRPASLQDSRSIRSLYLAAFPEEERDRVATLAVDLLEEQTLPETFALVATDDGLTVGHIAFSPVVFANADKNQGYLLAPLAVQPEFQKRRVGANLIEAGIEHLARLKADIVFVYGDPKYYGRFGFDAGIAAEYLPPYPLQFPFGWQAKLLTDSNTFPPSTELTCVPALTDPQLW